MAFNVWDIKQNYLMSEGTRMNVFKDLRVLELGRVYSGPLCGMVFSDLGAEVIKIERPGEGDESRKFGTQNAGGESCYFNSLNRNKKSIDLDLKDAKDKLILIELIKTADVIVHNWIQQSLDKLGFSYDEVKKMNPRIIYCSISGYGYNSPYRNQASQDVIAQSLSGLMSLTGEKEGTPLKTGIPIVDYGSGLYAAFSIMSALYMREKTGVGQLVHTSLLETALAITSFESSLYLSTGIVPERNGNSHPSICPYNVYKTKNGLVSIAVANSDMWKRFCDALNLKELKDDINFATNQKRLMNQDKLEEILKTKMLSYNAEELVKCLNEAKVSCTKVNDIKEAFEAPEVKALNMKVTCIDNIEVTIVNKPFHLENIENIVVSSPPSLGEDKVDLIKELESQS